MNNILTRPQEIKENPRVLYTGNHFISLPEIDNAEIDGEDPMFKNTIEYYYSTDYQYYFVDAQIREIACDHHPNTPSGLGLCGSIVNPLLRHQAL